MKQAACCALIVLLISTSPSSLAGIDAKPQDGQDSPLKGFVIDRRTTVEEVLESIPLDRILERFQHRDSEGRTLTYLAFTENEPAAIVFDNARLTGTLSRAQVQSFISCRAYSSLQTYWAQAAPAWKASLLNAMAPNSDVTLIFSGKPQPDSLSALISTNGGSAKAIKGSKTKTKPKLNGDPLVADAFFSVKTGEGENTVTGLLNSPDSVGFSNGGFVLTYTSPSLDFYVSDGIVSLIQQPSLNFIRANLPPKYYRPGTIWSYCSPDTWLGANFSN